MFSTNSNPSFIFSRPRPHDLDLCGEKKKKTKKNSQLAGHCLAVASWLTHLQSHFMNSYWIGFLVRGGGKTSHFSLSISRSLSTLSLSPSNSQKQRRPSEAAPSPPW